MDQSKAADTIYDQTKKEADEDKKSDEESEDKKSEEGEKKSDEEDKEGEKKSDEDKKSDEEDKKEDDKKDEEKSEPYKIELPDDLKVDKELVGELEVFANEHGIPKDKAEEFAKEIVAKQEASIQTVLDTWENESKADEEIGGAKFDENVAVAMKAVDRFGGPQLKSALEETGLGSHPEVIRAFFKVGKAMSDDAMFTSGNEKPAKKGGIESIYSTMEET